MSTNGWYMCDDKGVRGGPVTAEMVLWEQEYREVRNVNRSRDLLTISHVCSVQVVTWCGLTPAGMPYFSKQRKKYTFKLVT